MQDTFDSPDGLQQAASEQGVLRPKPEEDLETVCIKRHKAAGIRAQILGRETTAGVQNLIGLTTFISVLMRRHPTLIVGF